MTRVALSVRVLGGCRTELASRFDAHDQYAEHAVAMPEPNMGRMPFSYISGPYYTYEVTKWSGPRRTILEYIYVGRGKDRRGMAYYRLGRPGKGLSHRYFNPKGHNPGLDAEIAALRALGREIGIVAYDHGHDLAACRIHEKHLIAKHGRRDKGTGTLYNRNGGG